MKEKILIVDGHNLLFKMYYGIPNSIRRNGVEIKGVIGFIGVLLKLSTQFNSYSIIVVFDSETSTEENKRIDAFYKSNRPDYSKIEDNPFTQLQMIKNCLNYLKIFNLECSHYEADDYIASLCEQLQKDYSIVIVSTDKDFFQLVNENILVYQYYGKKSVLYGVKEVQERYGVAPMQFPLYLSIVGDTSDHVIGVRGIGPKKVIKVLNDNDFLNKFKDTIQTNLTLVTLNKKININNFSIRKLKLTDITVNQIINTVLK